MRSLRLDVSLVIMVVVLVAIAATACHRPDPSSAPAQPPAQPAQPTQPPARSPALATAHEPAAGLACPPAGWSREALLDLRGRKLEVADAASRQSLALDLLPCLAHADPELRDRVAFEALSTWMRQKLITPDTGLAMLERLLPQIAPAYPDPDGFARPFAALVLAEVVRMDRIAPFLSEPLRAQTATAAVTYLRSVRDYRGFSEGEGWRHGVAHGADLLLQLAVSPHTGKAQLDAILAAVAEQIAPVEHFYVHGEPERLARAVFFLMKRELHTPAEWTAWFERVTAPALLSQWEDAFLSQRGLAKRHDTAAFLLALYLYVREDSPELQSRVLEPLRAAIQRVP
jgi:hypothetical protein